MKIEITSISNETNWIRGSIDGYRFEAKHFDEPSCYGINNGRTSVLWVCDDTKKNVIINYSRGWDIKPRTKKQKEICDELVSYLEALPKRFSE